MDPKDEVTGLTWIPEDLSSGVRAQVVVSTSLWFFYPLRES